MAHFRELIVWQRAIELVVAIYSLTGPFPPSEQYGLTSQMRRAAVSVPSNIAEGSRRRGKEIGHFLSIAFGSASELETQIEICRRLKLGKRDDLDKCEELLQEVARMLNKMLYK